MERVEGYARVPLKVRCSMKWATPTWPAVSSREPASTYAATDTDRAAGSRALITRGPAGTTVRSNIRAMVADWDDGTPRGSARPPLIQGYIGGRSRAILRGDRSGRETVRLPLDRAAERADANPFGPCPSVSRRRVHGHHASPAVVAAHGGDRRLRGLFEFGHSEWLGCRQ